MQWVSSVVRVMWHAIWGVVIARVLDVPYLAEAGQPLIRFRGKYPALSAGNAPADNNIET